MLRPLAMFVAAIALVAAIPLVTQSLDLESYGPTPGDAGGDAGDSLGIWLTYDLAGLKARSTVIVLGDVTKIVAPFGLPEKQLVNTVFEFDVSEYVKGNGPDTIYVSHIGGTLDHVTVTLDGNPLFIVGERYVLFLANDYKNCLSSPPRDPPCILPSTPPDMTYNIVGGPQGKFLVVNGLVYGFKTLFPREYYFFEVDANGVRLEEFLRQVSEA